MTPAREEEFHILSAKVRHMEFVASVLVAAFVANVPEEQADILLREMENLPRPLSARCCRQPRLTPFHLDCRWGDTPGENVGTVR